ncbi:MAG: M20/M25/M40 family metallo-hydrolase [Bacteroidales bacterium]|nr:M20/M25/M40 family metallo-hydrolase [Bacteroidales bacterium]
MDINWFRRILSIDSSSGREREMGECLAGFLSTPANKVETYEVGDGTLNVFAKWGEPRFVFCTHCDTVPPYIPPAFEDISAGASLPGGGTAACNDTLITGRGTCDAKGQIFSMFEACKMLEAEGCRDFGLLVLAGEETGSFGAKAYTRDCPGAETVIVGEPTDGKMVRASKGTKSFGVKIKGRPCHSGYPHLGESAVEKFVDFCNCLKAIDFPEDPVLGPTTWNIGLLRSDNPQNILSPEVGFRLYFRTTFASDELVCSLMEKMAREDVEITPFGGDTPMEYFIVEGLPVTTVSFGSDAPRLERFSRRALCGPGSIAVAHTDKEYILLSDIEKAVSQYVKIFHLCMDC